MNSVVDAISDFSTWLQDTLKYMVGYPLGFFRAMYEKLFSSLNFLFESIIEPLWDLLASFVNQISLPSLILSFNALPGGIGYFLELFNIPVILMSVLSAYGIRFLIRRIPFIG